MKNTKYFYFTIKGDNLNVNDLFNEIDIKGEKYIKGEQSIFNPTKEKIVQETNRWVYSSISKVDDNIDLFLEEELKKIENNLQVLKKYMIDNYCLIGSRSISWTLFNRKLRLNLKHIIFKFNRCHIFY